jgi:hypothetical protein
MEKLSSLIYCPFKSPIGVATSSVYLGLFPASTVTSYENVDPKVKFTGVYSNTFLFFTAESQA